MERLNYQHLLYFWTVAREGSVAKATRALHLTQPTISGQIRRLEQALGEKLFQRAGRGLALTEVGRVAYRYADEIFGLGRELLDAVKGLPTGRPAQFVVGVADVIPKILAYQLLEAAFSVPEPLRIVCYEDPPAALLARLATHELDLVLSDGPVPPGVSVKAYNHLLGECSVAFFAAPALAKAHVRGFPRSLDGAPLLLPVEGTHLRRTLDGWFAQHELRPRVAGEFEDSALLKAFGEAGRGIFPAPAPIRPVLERSPGVVCLGTVEELRERYYAISVDRKLKHPAVVAISQAARSRLFA